MVDALAANGILNYGTSYAGNEKNKFMQVYGMEDVMKHGEKFEIDYLDPRYIEFWTRHGEYRIMCLIDYPDYQAWMKLHPETPVNKIGE